MKTIQNKNKNTNSNKKPIILTAALPYANGSAHLGHILEAVLTDVIARALKLSGRKVTFCCASDTHGTAIEVKAQKEGITPTQLVEKYGKEQLEDFKKFGVRYDSYYTTNSPENEYFANLVFKRLKDKNLIYQKEQELTYCEHCKRFLPDRFVKGECPKCGAKDQYGDNCEKCNAAYDTKDLKEPFCVLCKNTPIKKNSTNYFFKLSKFSDKLKEWLTTNKNLQSEVVNQVLTWINEGLRDWCVSRDGPYFGFKIPGEKDKYFYVWLDAPIGYISSLCNFYNKDKEKALEVWNKSEILHVIGKDIIYFHLLFWPAMLWGADIQIPKDIIVHGFITEKGEKMSKSRGALWTAKNMLKIIEPEHIRFYLAHNLPRKMSDFGLDLDDYKEKINSELIGNIANFAYRTLSFCNRFFDSKVLPIKESESTKSFDQKFEDVVAAYTKYELRDALNKILAISKEGNKFFQDNEPWRIIKEDKEKAHEVISFCVNLVKNINILLKPILPEFTIRIEEQLGLKNQDFDSLGFDFKNPITNINKAEIIFRTIEEIDISQFEKPKENPFAKLNLKVAKIIKVEDHPDAEKLYKIQVSLGKNKNGEEERRQICSGLKPYDIKPEDLMNKHIILVSNLKPAKLRGELSEGMLLAAQRNKKLVILQTEAKEGTQVTIKDIKPNKELISIEEFAKVKMTTKDKKAIFEGEFLKAGDKEITADIKDNAKIS